jgi:hypothetical protein
MNEQLAFDKAVDQWVSAGLTQPLTWDQLLYALPSVYPATVQESARRLSLSNKIRFGTDRSLTPGTRSFALKLWCQGKLPTPHPQDSLWWFGDIALERVLAHIHQLVAHSEGVLLLGTPSLFHYLKAHSLGRSVLLLDKDCSTIAEGHYRALPCDVLTDTATDEKFDVIVADPPWYPTETRAFLTAALRRSKQGTRLLVSVPGAGTRPGVQREWQELLLWAEGRGLRLLDYEARALPYISPLFERNALRAAGIDGYPEDWRRGDLAIFEFDGSAGADTFTTNGQRRWAEVRFGRVRLRVRAESHNAWKSPQLRTMVPGDILPSVSRRDRRLKSVGAWTSGNRVFSCEGCFAFWNIAEAMSLGECPVARLCSAIGTDLDAQQREEVGKVVKRLKEIIVIEEQEIEDWRTERNDNVVELPARQI